MIPVDYVINSILLASCKTAQMPLQPVEVYQACTTGLHLLTMKGLIDSGFVVYDKVKLDKNVSTVWAALIPNQRVNDMLSWFIEKLPLKMLQLAAYVTKNDKLV